MLRATLLLLAASGAMPAQEPAYEVASIKPNTSASQCSSIHGSTGQIIFTNVTLKKLIERAYKVKPFEITRPAWIESVAFEHHCQISAQHEGGRVKAMTTKTISIGILTDIVADNVRETVIDKTGAAGVYDLELRWANEDGDDTPSLFTALQETLGLRLQPQKVPVEIVVADHVDRLPTEN